MPEGPETHYVADRLRGVLLGAPLLRVAFSLPELQRYEAKLTGHRVEAIDARGKVLLTRFDNGLTLYTHSQLLGHWKIDDRLPSSEPTTTARVTLATKNGSASLYVAPKVEIWPSAKIQSHPFLAKLGPDVLDPDVHPADFVERLERSRFRRTPLATLLLKQEFAAGMGNYLRSEALYQARLSPKHRAGDLDDDQALRLAHALLDVPRRSYRAKFKAGLPADGKDYLATTKKTFRFQVFEREGEPCPDCGGKIVMERLASRRLYWCPRCQR